MINPGPLRRRWMLAFTAVAITMTATSQAFAVSPQNPYRTFNLSGVNYGSMRWERTHRGSSQQSRSRRSRSRRFTRGTSVTQLQSPGVVVGSTSGGVVVGSRSTGSPSGVKRSP